MSIVHSKDGTAIAYSKAGSGPAVVLVDGALCYREFGPNKALATELAKDFTVYTYDRRGRGESGDTQPYAPERELEDLKALVDMIGEPIYLYGISSGGALSLQAAEQLGNKVKKVAVYEIPFYVDNGHKPIPDDYVEHLNELVAAGKRSQAVKYFMTAAIGFPAPMVALFPLFPGWSKNKAIAHTLAYDGQFTRDYMHNQPLPKDKWQRVTQPTLVIAGEKSQAWMRTTAQALQKVLPNAEYKPLPGQSHIVKAAALGPMLASYFKQTN